MATSESNTVRPLSPTSGQGNGSNGAGGSRKGRDGTGEERADEPEVHGATRRERGEGRLHDGSASTSCATVGAPSTPASVA